MPVSLLPPRLAGLFEKWTRLVIVEIKCRSFTDYPSKSKLISDTIEFKVEPNVFMDMVKWLVEKKVNLKPSAITIRHAYGEDGFCSQQSNHKPHHIPTNQLLIYSSLYFYYIILQHLIFHSTMHVMAITGSCNAEFYYHIIMHVNYDADSLFSYAIHLL